MSHPGLRNILLMLALVVAGSAAPSGIGPGAQAGSTWLSTAYDDFNGTGMELDNCTINISGAGCAVQLDRSGNWQNRRPTPMPKADWQHSLARVGNRDELVLYGGIDDIGGGAGRYLNETWVYDIGNNTWTQRFPSRNPGWRYDSAMAPVYNEDRVLLYSGNGAPGAETWTYDLGDDQWYQLMPGTNPGWRTGHALAAIQDSADILLFGGSGDRYLFCDTWIFNTTDGRWTEVHPPEHPSARAGHALAPVWNTDEAVLFGGYGSSGNEKYNDTWVFDAGERRWHERKPAGSPPPRDSAGMTALLDSDKLMLFGGWLEYPQGTRHDTWTYDSGSNRWERLYPSVYPTGDSEFFLATSEATGNVISHGTAETWEFNFSLFQHIGIYRSPYHDTGGDSSFLSICWTTDVPGDTFIDFQIRTARSSLGLALETFVGPDGTGATYYTDYPSIWWGHHRHRWIQYRAVLRTWNLTLTPVLTGVRIDYNRLPQTPVLLEPSNGTWTNASSPEFKWTYNDSDSRSQGGFELQLSATTNFSFPNFTSGVVDSDRTQFTLNDTVADGTWHWRVRTRDPDGEWGPYSWHSILRIDSSPPSDFHVEAYPPAWTRDPCMILFETWDNLSGIDGYEVWIDKEKLGFQESPFTVPHQPDGVHKIVVRAYDLAGNFVESATRIFIDNGAPAPFTPSAGSSSWTNIVPQVYFEASDFASGIDHYEVSIDDGAFSRRASPYQLPDLAEGEHAITVRAFDRVGNARDGSTMVYLDRSGPIRLLLSVDAASWTNRDPRITFEATDPVSGIDRYEVMTKGGVFVSRTSPFLLTGLEDGTSLITVRAFDRAGNRAEGNLSVRLDKTPPDGFTPSADPAGWTRGHPVIRFSSSDRTSGIDHYGLGIDGGDLTTRSSPCNLFPLPDGEHRITVRAFDRAGNFRDGNISVFLDASAPSNVSVGLAGGKRTATRTSVELAIDATDSFSGLDRMCFSNDGVNYAPWEPFNTSKSWTLSTGAGGRTVFVKVQDRAGNEAVASATVEYAPASTTAFPTTVVVGGVIIIAAVLSAAFILARRSRRKARKRIPKAPSPLEDS